MVKTLGHIVSGYWKKRSGLEKLFLIIIGILICYGIYVTVEKAVFKYRYFKTIEKQYNVAKDSINALNIRVKELTEKQQKQTVKSRKKSQAINDKLKADEDIIDNTPIDDYELKAYISKHENG